MKFHFPNSFWELFSDVSALVSPLNYPKIQNVVFSEVKIWINDDLIFNVAAANPNTIVVVGTPGAALINQNRS